MEATSNYCLIWNIGENKHIKIYFTEQRRDWRSYTEGLTNTIYLIFDLRLIYISVSGLSITFKLSYVLTSQLFLLLNGFTFQNYIIPSSNPSIMQSYRLVLVLIQSDIQILFHAPFSFFFFLLCRTYGTLFWFLRLG